MIPLRFKVTEKGNASFHIQVNKRPYQHDELHFHPEYQISLILEGSGVISIGNNIEAFRAGDIFMIAPNIPHVFKSKSKTEQQQEAISIHIVSLLFLPTAFGDRFLLLPELVKINSFLAQTPRGVKIDSALANSTKLLFIKLTEALGAERIIKLLELLNAMALSPDKKFLSNVPYTPKTAYSDGTMKKIFNYISKNFDKAISLEEVSRIAHLNKYSFCRYFKKATSKSFIAYLNEFRVSMACKLLNKSTYNISQICYLVGFNNSSNFYRQFKKVMKLTPSRYRKLFGHADALAILPE